MGSNEGIEELADALAEFAHALWLIEEEKRTAADAATSSGEPASETEANQAGKQEP